MYPWRPGNEDQHDEKENEPRGLGSFIDLAASSKYMQSMEWDSNTTRVIGTCNEKVQGLTF